MGRVKLGYNCLVGLVTTGESWSVGLSKDLTVWSGLVKTGQGWSVGLSKDITVWSDRVKIGQSIVFLLSQQENC